MAMGAAQSTAFAAGAGVTPGRLTFVIAAAVAAMMLIWTAWVCFGQYRAWCERRIDFHDLSWSVVRASVWLMLVTYFIR